MKRNSPSESFTEHVTQVCICPKGTDSHVLAHIDQPRPEILKLKRKRKYITQQTDDIALRKTVKCLNEEAFPSKPTY